MICKLVLLIGAFIIAESATVSISASKTQFHKGDEFTVKCDFSLKSSEALNYVTLSVNDKEFYRYNHEDQSKHFSISHQKLKWLTNTWFSEVTTSPVLGSTATAAGLPGTAVIKNATELSEGIYSCEVNFTVSKQVMKQHSTGVHISFAKWKLFLQNKKHIIYI